MLTDEARRNIINQHLKNIHHISDKEYQKRVWIRGEGPECDDFDETVNYFFGEMDSILDEYKKFWITDSQYQILKKFRDKFRAFSDGHSYEPLFIDTPEWSEITEMAKEVLKAFDYPEVQKTESP
jgi:hypothetical protein